MSRDSELSVSRQCELVGLPRSTFYAPEPKHRGFTCEEERAMAIMDAEQLACPSYGARLHMRNLAKHGIFFSRRHCARLMEHMGLRSIAPKPSTSKPARHHPKFPYLLKGKRVDFPNQVWSTDITYIPLGRGHVYLSAVIDWHSRYIVGWRLSDTMRAEDVVRCVRRAFAEHGTPSVMNSDQGSVFGSDVYVSLLASNRVTQSMDGRARWRDNVLMERWFRTLKSEWLRTHEYSTPKELGRLVAEFVGYYNDARIHQSLGYDTPASWYYAGINERVA